MKLNDFMREGAGAQAELQNLIDRKFRRAAGMGVIDVRY